MKKSLTNLGILAFISIFSIMPIRANALENVNIGRKLSETEYNNLKTLGLDDDVIANLEVDTFNEYKDFITTEQVTEEKYFKDYSVYSPQSSNHDVVLTKEITKEEYENDIVPYGSTHETNSKKLSITLSKGANNVRAVVSTLEWKVVPKNKSVDVFALYATNGGLGGAQSATQVEYENAPNPDLQCVLGRVAHTYNYSSTNAGWNIESSGLIHNNGTGISMQLKQSKTTCANDLQSMVVGHTAGYKFTIMNSSFPVNGSTVTIRASYQHSQSSVSLADSKKYNFRTYGYGGVINFNSTSIASKFDKMGGVEATL